MAKLTQHDRNLRDSRFLKGRLLNIQRLVTVLRDEHFTVQTQEDSTDLIEISKTLEKMLGRLDGVSMPNKK